MTSKLCMTCAVAFMAIAGLTATAATVEEPEWIRQFGTRGNNYASGVTTSPDGRVHVVGTTSGALGGARKGYDDPFIITFDRDGSELWRRQPGTASLDGANAVAADAESNVYVVGYSAGDALVIKFDRDGRTIGKRQPSTTDPENASGVATDTSPRVSLPRRSRGVVASRVVGGRSEFV